MRGCLFCADFADSDSLLCLFPYGFYSPKRVPLGEDEYEILEGEIYEPYREKMIEWMKELRRMPHEEFSPREAMKGAHVP